MGMYDQLDGMDEILDDFVVETNDLIEQLNEDLLALESGNYDSDLVNRVFRAFHTIKGTSGFLGFSDCNNLAHSAEDLLNRIRNDEIEPTPQIVDTLLETIDWFKTFNQDVEARSEKLYDISDLTSAIHALLEKRGPTSVVAEPAAAPDEPAPTTIPQELIDEFVIEGSELIDTLNNDLLNIEQEADNEELVNNIFRAFHTLKGNCGLVGLTRTADLAHKSEDLLNLIRDKKQPVNSQIVDSLLEVVDFFRTVVEEVREGKVTEHDPRSVDQHLQQLLGAKAAPQATAEKKSAGTQQKSPKRTDQTIRVDVERLNNLMNLAGELILGKNRLLQVTQELNARHSGLKEVGDLESLNNSLSYVTTEIQESVMQMRMLPISSVFRRFPRLVRDLARDNHKQIDLVLSGEDTELDRSVIEAIGDPLVHILRNSVDHGIEDPQTRRKRGKPETGTIRMEAFQEGNNIVIRISDDGAGIDPQRVAQKAVEKKIITEEEARSMSKRDLVNLIFRPGFSTAQKVTDVSGRGVGMDVVHSNVAKLNGTVEVQTEVNEGTTLTIKLPLTLTIMTGMVVKVFQELYIIPLNTISDTVKLSDYRLSTIKGLEVIKLRDTILPIIRLDEVLNVPVQSDKKRDTYVVVVAVAEKRLGLTVSELLGQEETVVKPLGQIMGKVPFITGASIRGDGRISLILDVPELVELLSNGQGGTA